ncbi:MAG TPA: STAS domain-containing protein [Nocardioides sp.]|nr:STAS domain-containing protein [Nocardioides sp.]
MTLQQSGSDSGEARVAAADEFPILDVRIRFNPSLPLVRLVGELDLNSLHLLADAMYSVTARPSENDLVLLDLAGVTFCDLAGLRAIEACALNLETTAAKRLILYRPSRQVAKLIRISGVAAGLERR